ncbi:hypothetical protein SCUCBS95973_009675 [Sporothrix curviconia]|uniref:LysM domain-containing protein n=1 Tax=Sporothrix curviconia TaxID=1260050 RepID=A0ABP0CWY1_9PEZI
MSLKNFIGLSALARLVVALPAAYEYNVLPTIPNIINLNVTIGDTYTVVEGDTVASIASKYGVGLCDVARLNVLADPEFIYPGEILNIPASATFPDDTSCLTPNNTDTTNTCIYGGPHVYTILPGDTIQKIANKWFNITTESILSFGAQTGYIQALNPGIYDVLDTGATVKIPACSNTACTMTDYTFSYGTLQDFAAQYNVTVGQIMSLNLGYNHTEAIAPLGVVYNCAELTS